MRRKPRPGGGRQAEITIESLGGRGDGIGELDGRPVFVPLTLPGDRVRLRLTGERAGGFKGEVMEWLEFGPGRIDPPCRHYGPCGGCVLQHIAGGGYLSWQRDKVVQALTRRGLPADVIRPPEAIPPGTRRRASLSAVRRGTELRLGFRGRASHEVVDLRDCLLLTPGLVGLLAGLRETLAGVLADGESATVALLESVTGMDVLLVSACEPGLAERQSLAGFAREANLARLSWALPGGEAEPIAQHRAPLVDLGGVSVEPPPGGFLQPSVEGEAVLRNRIIDYLPKQAGKVLDLYAGCGSFTFALAARARVHAVEGDEAALAALWAAARRAGLSGRISVEARDLDRRPLETAELGGFDAIVFDPPRAGAKEQAARIAASTVPAALAVSCNLNTFARDARILLDGGFKLVDVAPVDQFPWSGHVELAAKFLR